MNAPDVALVFINMALDLSCREERAENMLWLAQTLVALRRLDEAWATALEVCRAEEKRTLLVFDVDYFMTCLPFLSSPGIEDDVTGGPCATGQCSLHAHENCL